MKKFLFYLAFICCIFSSCSIDNDIVNDIDNNEYNYNISGIWSIKSNENCTIKNLILYNNYYEYSYYYDCVENCYIHNKSISISDLLLDEFINYYNNDKIYIKQYPDSEPIVYKNINKSIGIIKYNKHEYSHELGFSFDSTDKCEIIKANINNDILSINILYESKIYNYQFKILEYKHKVDFNKGIIPDEMFIQCIKDNDIHELNITVGKIYNLIYKGLELHIAYITPI